MGGSRSICGTLVREIPAGGCQLALSQIASMAVVRDPHGGPRPHIYWTDSAGGQSSSHDHFPLLIADVMDGQTSEAVDEHEFNTMSSHEAVHQPIHPDVRPLLDPEYVTFHDQYFQYLVPDDQKVWDGSARLKSPSLPLMESSPIEVGKIENLTVGNFDVRTFTPSALPDQCQPWPVFIWFHGGGWAVGDVNMSNDLCALICDRAKCVVITVGYRLAPEHPFPAAFEDAVDALKWIHSDEGNKRLSIDRRRIALGGTSAGGQLAASLVMKAATLQPPIPVQFQILVVPVIDNTATVDGIWSQNRNAPWLTPARMLWYRRMYLLNESDCARWEASPNLASKELLATSPKTWIAVSEQDLLAPEAQRYAEQLRMAWNTKGIENMEVKVRVYGGSTHSVLAMSGQYRVTHPLSNANT